MTRYVRTPVTSRTAVNACWLTNTGVLKYGYGWHEADLPETIRHAGTPLKVRIALCGQHRSDIANKQQLFWLCQVLFKISILFTKLSLFFVYYDLLDQVESLSVALSRAVNYFTAILVFGYYTAATFVSVFACVPIYKSWTPKADGYCINNGAFLYSTAAANILTSLLLIGIPLPLLLRTRFRKREITQLVGLILLGLVYVPCPPSSKNKGLPLTNLIVIRPAALFASAL